MAEQLVDVPTQHIVELLLQHPVDIPFPHFGVSGGGQQGFLSGQGSVGEQIVDIPASGRGVSSSLLGIPQRRIALLSGLWSRSLLVESFLLVLHVVEVLVVVFMVFLRFRASQWNFSVPLGDADEGGFRTFPRSKKGRRLVLAPGRNWPRTRAHPRRALVAL